MRKNAYRVGNFGVFQELGRELERHGESVTALIRLGLDTVLADFPHLRDLYNDNPTRTPSTQRRKLRIMERELADRIEMVRAQRAARYLCRLRGKIFPASELTPHRMKLRAERRQKDG